MLDSVLEDSDIMALRLKQCLESDWTSKLTLQHMRLGSKPFVCLISLI